MDSGGAFDDDAQFQQYAEDAARQGAVTDNAPSRRQRLGRFTVICLVLNRTIGSGIFVTPARVLIGTGSVGAVILFWVAGGLVATCGLLVWLEFGLSVPLTLIPGGGGERRATPRSGGEKNCECSSRANKQRRATETDCVGRRASLYRFLSCCQNRTDASQLEFAFGRPLFLTTCMYGIVFTILGNLSGNAIAFGSYVMTAAGSSNPSKGAVIGLAIFALSACIILHTLSRAGGIAMNNAFAVYKVLLLLTIIILGFIKAGGHDTGGDLKATDNLSPHNSFQSGQHNAVSWYDSFLFVLYTYSGFKQPFYVLAEISRPRKIFPSCSLAAMAIVITLFTLVNVSYFCVVRKEDVIDSSKDMATLFLIHMFGQGTAQRTMAALIATSIFGNILVMTFVAARVKQEIAKEGVLPFSLFFATAKTTVLAPLVARVQRAFGLAASKDHLEHAPIAALMLHWFTSVFLIAVTAMLPPAKSYTFLISLYSYVIVVGFGFVVSGSLLYVKMDYFSRRDWKNVRNFHVWLDGRHLFPWHAITYFCVCGFLLYASFAKPSATSPLSSESTGIPWWVVPAIGQSTWLWGVVWFGGLHLIMKQRRERLVVMRFPLIEREKDSDQWVQKGEVVQHQWLAVEPPSDASSMHSTFPHSDDIQSSGFVIGRKGEHLKY